MSYGILSDDFAYPWRCHLSRFYSKQQRPAVSAEFLMDGLLSQTSSFRIA
jgi:hypothetical protein